MNDALVMPVYNEASTAGQVLDAVRRFYDGVVIVVDDGSTDGTSAILGRRADVVTIWHEKNLGYGRSLIDGFAAAFAVGAERIVTMDCDGQHEPTHIPAFLKAMDRADIVSGSRYLPGSGAVGAAPSDRVRINERVTHIINEVTGWGITDAFCGFKAYRADALRRLHLGEDGYGMPLELWAEAWRHGLSVVELPIERIYCDHDRSFGSDLDDPDRRLRYYLSVWRQALSRSCPPGSGAPAVAEGGLERA